MRCGLYKAEFPEENVSSLAYAVKIVSEEPGNAILANILPVLQQLAHCILHVREDMSLSCTLISLVFSLWLSVPPTPENPYS